jgi:hypothetical protein
MPAKKVFEIPEEAAEYNEFLRRRNSERAKEFYDNKIYTNPENMKNIKNKCKRHSNDFIKK